MKINRALFLTLAMLLALCAPRAAFAQQQSGVAPLAGFVASVARLWSAGDADGLVALATQDGRILLDLTGEGSGEMQPRNAAAALRRLFGERETVTVRPTAATISGGSPLRGFGELTWVARPRGVSESVSSVVYVGAVWDGNEWRIRELRVLR
jgi:hypothetical protein